MLVSGHEPDDLSGPWNYGCVQVDMTAIEQNEFIECDGELMRRSEVGIQCVERSRAAWDGVNSRDPASCRGAHGNDETIEDIDGLHDTPGDRLADLPNAHFLVESDLQRGAVGNGHCDGVGFGRRLWRGGLRLGDCNLRWQAADEGPGKQKHRENTTGHHSGEDLST